MKPLSSDSLTAGAGLEVLVAGVRAARRAAVVRARRVGAVTTTLTLYNM